MGETEGLTQEQVKRLCDEFCGGNMIRYRPMYSALKVKRQKSCMSWHGKGRRSSAKSRKVEIKEIRILEMALPRVRMEVSCSKGTYIRTLCHDIGEKLGCFGCMESLLRTKVSRFEIESSLKLSEIQKKKRGRKAFRDYNPSGCSVFPISCRDGKKRGAGACV